MERLRAHRAELIAAAAVATSLGVGGLVLQRWVAETRGAAIAMVVAWYALVLIGALVALRAQPRLRQTALATIAVITVTTVAVGYWTGFRDKTVDEDVVVATVEASPPGPRSQDVPEKQPSAPGPARPVNLAKGSFAGVDGHAGGGTATVVEDPGGKRFLTFTEFDVDPGPQVIVYLTRDESGPGDDPVDLGNLKGNVGDQQYEIPADADLREFDTVVLWCAPFTTRIAIAPLR